jgi:hypothetical protein
MVTYALLTNPGHNRVYYEESKKLAAGELQLALTKLSISCGDVKSDYIAGVHYVVFSASDDLSEEDIAVIGMLSFVYAIFEIKKTRGLILLLPIMKINNRYIDENIGTILKYTGKTNELFTRMMINIALFCSDFSHLNQIRLLDPVAGKGTTLFEGLVFGYDVYGIEIGEKIVSEAYHFLKKYLETEKYKHTVKTEKVSAPDKAFKVIRHSFDIAKTKEEQKGGNLKHVELIAGNSANTDKFFKKNFFHLIVGDLPYGVQHGNVTNEKQSSLTRNPKELLNACLPAWYRTLMNGGTLVLSWNLLVLPRENMVSLLNKSGFTVIDGDSLMNFRHRVDRSINRDIVVAKKTRR